MGVKSLDEKGFRFFLKEGKLVPKNLAENTVRSHIKLVKEFEEHMKNKRRKGLEDAGPGDVRSFLRHLSKDGRDSFDEVIGLLRYARFAGKKDMELALLIVLDGGNVLPKLCETFKNEFGQRKYDEVLGGFEPPPIGTSSKVMPKFTREFMERIEKGIGEEATRALLLTGPHAGPPEYYEAERRLFESSRDVDEFLARRRERFINLLRTHMRDGTYFFTQKIDKEVLDFVIKNPQVAGGVRRGTKIIHTKIPHMTIEYLREKDPTMKRYYYCHCPLARESILRGESMSKNLCYCSAGYEKRPFDVAFGIPARVQVLKSVLWGDPVCQFAIEIPEEVRKRS